MIRSNKFSPPTGTSALKKTGKRGGGGSLKKMPAYVTTRNKVFPISYMRVISEGALTQPKDTDADHHNDQHLDADYETLSFCCSVVF